MRALQCNFAANLVGPSVSREFHSGLIAYMNGKTLMAFLKGVSNGQVLVISGDGGAEVHLSVRSMPGSLTAELYVSAVTSVTPQEMIALLQRQGFLLSE